MSRHQGYWGASAFIDKVRGLLIHRTLSEDVQPEHLVAMAQAHYKPQMMVWRCTSARILGPGQDDGTHDGDRLTVYVTADRRVTDVGIG